MRSACAAGTLALILLPTHMTRLMDAPSAGAATVPLQVVRGIVARNATLETALGDALPRGRIYELVEVARPVYDLARLSVGHPFGLALGPGGILEAFTYGIDELQTLRVFRRGEALTASLETRHYDERVVTISGSVESSLFAAVENVGERDQLALDLADIFAWDVDFNTELRAGDSFRVTVEKLSLEGRFSRYGRILAAELQRGDRRLLAVRYDGLGTTGYFAPDGTPLRKAFLRSPLRFSRISSRFSRARLHPILRTVRPHLGVDYAAPVGTPVMAASDGVVTGAGWEGGFGKMVRLRHANGYETFYGHLSRISVRRGQRVQQGATLGAVGQTGLATGPHLDYRMRRNGFFVNPLTVQLPPAEPVPLAERSAFQSVRDRALARLGGTSRGPQAVRSQLGPEDPLLEADRPWRQAR